MAHTIVTNYSDLHPTPKDNSLVVVFNKDGTINLDKETLQSLITQPPESTLLSFVRVTDDGKSDDHSDHSSDDGTTPHINLTVDAFFDHNPDEIFDDGSVEDLLLPLHIDIKEHCLEAFRNDHCYTPLTSPSQTLPVSENILAYVDLENDIISHSIAKPQIPNSKKITILEQKIIPKGKTLLSVNTSDAKVILKGAEALRSSLSGFGLKNTYVNVKKPIIDKQLKIELKRHEIENNTIINKNVLSQSSSDSVTSDSDSDYKDSSDRKLALKAKPKQPVKSVKKILNRKFSIQDVHTNADASINVKKVLHGKSYSRKATPKSTVSEARKLLKPKLQKANKLSDTLPPVNVEPSPEVINYPKDEPKTELKSDNKLNINQEVKTEIKPELLKVQKSVLKKDKKTPSHVTALLSDMTSLFSTPDVIRRVSSDSKTVKTPDKQMASSTSKAQTNIESVEKDVQELTDDSKFVVKMNPKVKTYSMTDAKHPKVLVKESNRKLSTEKSSKDISADIPQLDESALAQLFTDTNSSVLSSLPSTTENPNVHTNNNLKENVIMSPNTPTSVGLAGSLSPSHLLSGLQADDEVLSEDLLRHVAHLVENNEKLQEVIDKQVLGKVTTDNIETKANPTISHISELHSQSQISPLIDQSQLTHQDIPRIVAPVSQKQPVQIVRSDGRVITLPPIEAPATRSSKRRSLNVSHTVLDTPLEPVVNDSSTPNLKELIQNPLKQYSHKKLVLKKNPAVSTQVETKMKEIDDIAESDASWNSEDDPNRLWCICKQPHNNRFMICCDSCEDWFHGKCVNITKAMGHQMEEQGVEWNCPNCLKKKAQAATFSSNTKLTIGRRSEAVQRTTSVDGLSNADNKVKSHITNTTCIVCKKSARASSIYCSDVCILRHAQESSSTSQTIPTVTTTKTVPKQNEPDRVIVYERKTGRVFAGPKAPTSANLKAWLQQNPTFEVVSPGTLNSGPKSLVLQKSAPQKPKIQTTLKVNPQKQAILVSPPRMPGVNPKQSLKSDNRESVPVKKEVSPQITPKSSIPMKRDVTPHTTPKSSKTPSSPKSSKVQNAKQAANKSLTVRTVSSNQSPSVKSPPPSSAKRKEDFYKSRSDSIESNKDITPQQRSTVKKSLQDQMTLRMTDTSESKMTSNDVRKFVNETEMELYDLYNKDVAKYKAKYRSLVFNIGDKKNKSLWQKICDGTVTPKQLVRLSPEELASQELAQWRDKEAKHQLELIKKSELDLLTCTKTYVLKTHKGEEVMESRSSGTTAELDPNVAVEDLVTALNDPNGASKQLTANRERSPERHKNKHKSHKTSKKAKRDHSLSRKEDSSSHKHSSKHGSKDLTKKDDAKTRDSRKASHKDRHKTKSERVKNPQRSKSKDITSATPEKLDMKIQSVSHDHIVQRSKSRGRSKHRSSSRGRMKHRSSSRGKSKPRSSSRGRAKQRSSSRGRSKHRSSSRSRAKHRSSSRGRSKHRSSSMGKSKHRSPSRGKSKPRSSSRGRAKHRSRSGTRLGRRSHSRGHSKHQSRDRSKHRSQSRSRSRHRSDSEALHKHRSYSKEMDSSEFSSSSKESHGRRVSTNIHERSLSQESSDKSKSYQADGHPEYDPHVAMVTSALSEEDLRKSKDDSFDESSVNDMLESSLAYVLPQEEYDPAKSGNYDLVSSTPLLHSSPDVKLSLRLSSGTESDQEPTSTVDSVPATVWTGCINMVDVARFYVTAHEVSGNCSDIGQDLNSELEIVGRINPDTVWDYIVKMKKASNKDILVLRLTAANVEERVQYIALYSYLSSRNRLGVIKVSNTMYVKDFYIFPLSSHAPIPNVLLPLDGPGFEDIRPHLLVGVMIRQRKKRPFPEPAIQPAVAPPKVLKMDKSAITTSTFRSDTSYTPPTSPYTNTVSSTLSLLPNLPPLSALSSSVKDKIAASLAAADNDNEPYSPGGSDSSASSESLKPPLPQTQKPTTVPANDDLLSRKLQELERKIAEERKQIISISKNISSPSVELDEPYSPSRPMTPANSVKVAPLTTLSDISLPSNLQEILATIQKKTQPAAVEEYVPEQVVKVPAVADVDMRMMNPPLPPHDFSVPPPPFFPTPVDSTKSVSKLSMLSDEDLLKMVPSEEIAPPPIPVPKPPPPPTFDHTNYHAYRKMKLEMSQPPAPGDEDNDMQS